MLLFSWPVHVHKQAYHLPQKSWGNGRASPYKGNKGKGRGRGWRGVSVQCVEIGRPELVGGKASKARAQPPHSHQLRGMWRQWTRASSAAPQPHSFSFSHYSTDQGPVSQKHLHSNCVSALLFLNVTFIRHMLMPREDFCGLMEYWKTSKWCFFVISWEHFTLFLP